jgi:hypothetical protein
VGEYRYAPGSEAGDGRAGDQGNRRQGVVDSSCVPSVASGIAERTIEN